MIQRALILLNLYGRQAVRCELNLLQKHYKCHFKFCHNRIYHFILIFMALEITSKKFAPSHFSWALLLGLSLTSDSTCSRRIFNNLDSRTGCQFLNIKYTITYKSRLTQKKLYKKTDAIFSIYGRNGINQ